MSGGGAVVFTAMWKEWFVNAARSATVHFTCMVTIEAGDVFTLDILSKGDYDQTCFTVLNNPPTLLFLSKSSISWVDVNRLWDHIIWFHVSLNGCVMHSNLLQAILWYIVE